MSINDTSGGFLFIGLSNEELEAFKKKWTELSDKPVNFTNIAIITEDNESLETQSPGPGETG